ncbi:hypothetical protein [Paenibacillus sp. IHBB 3054]|uniref:hypothetical protein n=1 Tax=Paenibacillus sp. IHBB 3054 TaxID=3425689 RepID=UPI003F67C296
MGVFRKQSFRSKLKTAFLAVILLSVLMTGGLSYSISAAILEKNALMAGRLIASLPADLITLCVGVNVYGAATLSPRVFAPALIGMLLSIRERHPLTQLFVISPIYGSERETEPNKLGFTLLMMREEIARTVEVFRARGDSRMHYRDGLSWFGESDSVRLPDGLHPDAEGYELLGARFAERILR